MWSEGFEKLLSEVFSCRNISISESERQKMFLERPKVVSITLRFMRRKDVRLCPKCGSTNVRTVFELISKSCLKCKEGIIEEIITGIVS